MDIVITLPDSLVSDAEKAFQAELGIAAPAPVGPVIEGQPVPEAPAVDSIDVFLKRRWENELDQRIINYLSNQAQQNASQKVTSLRSKAK